MIFASFTTRLHFSISAATKARKSSGVFVPTGTPPAIIQKLNAGLNAMLKEPAVTDRLNTLNVEYRPNTPEDFRAFVASEMEKWSRVVKEANIKIG